MKRGRRPKAYAAALAALMLVAPCGTTAAQEYAGREKLRAQSNELRMQDAKRIKAQALIELGERQINAIARNYYLTAAQYLLRDLPPQ